MRKLITIGALFTSLAIQAQLVVYSTNIVVTGCFRANGCPGGYCGFVKFYPTNSSLWGFVPVTNQSSYTATDTNHPNTKVESFGYDGDINCDLHTVEVPTPLFSPQYRFTVLWTNKSTIPTNGIYSLVLTNFTD